MDIRNIAIIAHVDHGKTTLTDAIMRQTGAFEEGMSMDTNAIEQERGITIYSKNSAFFYKGTKINIVDTPGHADFGSEVERVLRAIDSVLLVVDAQEGPMPQTRFVLKKSLELGLKPIVVINKIDRPAADVKITEEAVLELFFDLGANDEQLNFPVVYTVAREGIAMLNYTELSKDLNPLLDLILEKVPPANSDISAPLLAQPFNLGYDNFLGRLAVARVYEGTIGEGDNIYIKNANGETRSGKITKLFTFRGIAREETKKVYAGDIVMIAGLPDITIGETICASTDQEALPAIKVDEPTIVLYFLVNDSPLAGRDGKFVTSRQIRERLEKELEINVGLQVDFSNANSDGFKVYGRGELHIAILLENMRREGYEVQVSQPQVIIKEIDGVKMEPFEEIIIDVPIEFQGDVIENMGRRGAKMLDIRQQENTVRLIFKGSTRGLFGYRGEFVVSSKGEGILSSRVTGFEPYAGEINRRQTGSMVSMMTGKALAYSLWNLQERGTLYINANTEVYEGMVIGNISKGVDLAVNPIKGKHLTNMRKSTGEESIHLTTPHLLTIESGLEIIGADEYLEITPKNVRLRKKHLTELERKRADRSKK